MKTKTLIILICTCAVSLLKAQDVKRISKSAEAMDKLNHEYANAIKSSRSSALEQAAYANKDSLIFLKDLAAFFEAFETSLRTEDAARGFISNNRRLEYVVYVSNTGYTDAFYYDFENGKMSLSFVSAAKTFIANHKWENSKKVKFVHRGIYTFK